MNIETYELNPHTEFFSLVALNFGYILEFSGERSKPPDVWISPPEIAICCVKKQKFNRVKLKI